MGSTKSKELDTQGGDIQANEADSHDTRVSFSIIDWFAAANDKDGQGLINVLLMVVLILSIIVFIWKRCLLARRCADFTDRKNSVRRSSRLNNLEKDVGMEDKKDSVAFQVMGPTPPAPPFYPVLGSSTPAQTFYLVGPAGMSCVQAPPPPPPSPPPPPYSSSQLLQDNTPVFQGQLTDLVSKMVESAATRAMKLQRARRRELEEDGDVVLPGTPRPRTRSLTRTRFEDPETVVEISPPGTAEMERRLMRGLSQSTQNL